MSNLPQQSDQALSEELVAYLDGELVDGDRKRVEQRIATDPRAQQELQRLQGVWDLLDRLPRSEVNESFTRSTVEMVSVAVAEEVKWHQAAAPVRRVQRWLVGVIGATSAAIVGFAIIHWAIPDPNRALVRDLPVLENLEQYRHAESVDFLKKLRDEGLFGEEVDDAS